MHIVGTDATGSVEVELTRQGQVRVGITSLPDALRDAGALRNALDDAYAAAVSERTRAERGPLTLTRGQLPQPVGAGPKPVRLPRDQRTWQVDTGSDPTAGEPARPVSGRSSDSTVTVRLHLSDGWGELELDPEWLRVVQRRQLGNALNEAFEDAYRRQEAQA